jgi:hypothetical protein
MWDTLRQLKPLSNISWLVLGDFNEVLWPEEHLSNTPRSVYQMEALRDILYDCNLSDLGFSGVPYTYDNKRKGRANIRVRLDRVVACPAWHDIFTDSCMKHLTSPVSDQCHVMVELTREVSVRVYFSYVWFW